MRIVLASHIGSFLIAFILSETWHGCKQLYEHFVPGIFCISRWMLSSATHVYVVYLKMVLSRFLQSDALPDINHVHV